MPKLKKTLDINSLYRFREEKFNLDCLNQRNTQYK